MPPLDLRPNPDLPMHRQWIIVDLDGTLCDIRHRLSEAMAAKKSGDPRAWDLFHDKCGQDLPVWSVVLLLRAWLYAGGRIVYISARPVTFLFETKSWLRALSLPDAPLYLRMVEEQTSVEMKTHAAGLAIPPGDAVAFVLEDRDKLVMMWRNYGAACFQVAKGEY